jgi:uncharacterized damage-inducible protein DinB
VCPEVYDAWRKSEEAKSAKSGITATATAALKASAAIDIFSFGLLLTLIGGNNAARHGRHGNYTVLPAHIEEDAELRRLLCDQSALNEYVIGKKKIGERRSEVQWEHMKRKSWVDIIAKMIAIDPKVRLQTLKDVIKEFSIAVTMRKMKIEELEGNNSFLKEEIVKKLSELQDIFQSSFESVNRSLREVVNGIPDNSQLLLADLSASIDKLIDGLPEVTEPSDLSKKIDALHQEFEESTAKIQKAVSESEESSKAAWSAPAGSQAMCSVDLIDVLYHVILDEVI